MGEASSIDASQRAKPVASQGDWLLHNRADYRQIGIIAVHWLIVGTLFFNPWGWREQAPVALVLLGFLAACYFAFLNTVVIHNHVHKGIFRSNALNRWFRCILSFGVLYPASANTASHNLVHHHFSDDGQPDWAAPENVSFRWNLLNLIHFPNVVGPNTFNGVSAWARTTRQRNFRSQYLLEQIFAFGLTGLLLVLDPFAALCFVVMPQLWGARGILRINLIQHDGCDVGTDWNHSRNFVGRGFNWIMCNNGYHTIHHNRADLHWSVLNAQHEAQVVERIDPSLEEKSMLAYLWRTYALVPWRPARRDVAAAEVDATPTDLPSVESRRAAAESEALAS